MKLDWDTSIALARPEFEAKGACQEGLDVANRFKTFGEAIAAIKANPSAMPRGFTAPAWFFWCLMNFDMSRRCQLEMVDHIAAPMACLQIFMRGPDTLHADALTALREKFAGKLPHAEKQLREGRVSSRRSIE